MKKFFLILGGAGVGKNYYIKHNLPKTTVVIDVDEIKKSMPVDHAISSLKGLLEKEFEKNTPIVAHPSIGKNPTANINKLKLAKTYGYETNVIFLNGSPEQGIKNVEKRVKEGEHGAPEETIKTSYKKSYNSFQLTINAGKELINNVQELTVQMESFKRFFKNQHTQVLMEADMLDISILNVDKARSKLLSLLEEPVTVTEKTDGVKLTIVRTAIPLDSDWKQNWIVSYKGNVIYPEDFEGIDDKTSEKIKAHSIGVSQFKLIFDVLKKAQTNQDLSKIPPSTELFFEFLMKKPTLTREYTRSHQLILLSSSPCKYKEEFGRLITKSEQFDITKREEYSEILHVNTPAVLFTGKLSEIVSTTSSPEEAIKELKNHFLPIPSEYGGVMEGVVLEFDSGIFLKIVQEDQYSKQVRQSIKQKHGPENSENYYNQISTLSRKALESIGIQGTARELLSNLSKWIYSSGNNALFHGLDPNKSDINAKDDVLLTAKTLLFKKLPGNNNALFIGRFSPLTIAHYSIIEKALSTYDHVVVNIVKSKLNIDNPFPVEVQKDMLNKCFDNNIEIIVTETGNLLRSIQKCSKTINVVLAGSDRFENYKQQLENNKDIVVREIPRINEVSGTKVRKSLVENDYETFKQNVPKQIWGMFDELKTWVSRLQ